MFVGKSSISVARYGVPGVVLGVALACLVGVQDPPVQAQLTGPEGQPLLTHPTPAARAHEMGGTGRMPAARPAASGESAGTISLVVPSNNGSAQWLYIIDTKAHSFIIFKVDTAAQKTMVKLEASRHYEWDLKLDNYNNTGLEPAAIEKIVKSLAQQTKH